jgi:hypothetical protein
MGHIGQIGKSLSQNIPHGTAELTSMTHLTYLTRLPHLTNMTHLTLMTYSLFSHQISVNERIDLIGMVEP